MAEADEKSITSRYLTLPQAAARIGWEELRYALEDGRLLASERKTRTLFEELAHFLQGFALRGVAEADLNAVRAISGGYAIPPSSWRRWFADGSVFRENGEVVRPFEGYGVVIYRPMLLRADVPEHPEPPYSHPEPTRALTGDRPTATVVWITAAAKREKADGQI